MAGDINYNAINNGTLALAPYNNVDNIFPSDFWGSPVIEDSNGDLQCPGFRGNLHAANPWDFCVIANFKTPGRCEVEVRKERLLDRQKPAGRNQSRLNYTGMEPALLSIRIIIWTPMQFEYLKDMWNQIFPVNTPNNIPFQGASKAQKAAANWPPAYAVAHPTLKIHKVSGIAILGADGPVVGPGPRERTFIIKGIEYNQVQTNQKDAKAKPVETEIESTLKKDQHYPTAGSNPAVVNKTT